MTRVIVVRTSGDLINAVSTLNRIKKQLPEMTREAMRKWGSVLVKDMKGSAISSGVKDFTGTTQTNGIRWEQGMRSDEGYLFMRLYLIYLDSMAPHFVSVNLRRTRLLAWAKSSGSASIRKKARMVEKQQIKRFGIYVKPHPFIAQGYRRARPKLRPILKQMASIGVNS